MIRVVIDDVEWLFDTETEAAWFYHTAKVERYITVYDEDGNQAYGAINNVEDEDTNGQ